jgi:Domain of unknown function (DUF4136)
LKKIIYNGILCVLTATLADSCAPTVKVTTDYDRSANFAAYKSFSLSRFTKTLNVNELNAKRILNSVRSEMIKKGYVEDNYNPDLMINVVSLLNDRNFISASSNGMYGPYDFWLGGSGNTTISTTDYKDGSIIVHVVDVNKNTLLWEGIGNAEMTKQPKNLDEAINNAVAKIMNEFPHSSTNALPQSSTN